MSSDDEQDTGRVKRRREESQSGESESNSDVGPVPQDHSDDDAAEFEALYAQQNQSASESDEESDAEGSYGNAEECSESSSSENQSGDGSDPTITDLQSYVESKRARGENPLLVLAEMDMDAARAVSRMQLSRDEIWELVQNFVVQFAGSKFSHLRLFCSHSIHHHQPLRINPQLIVNRAAQA